MRYEKKGLSTVMRGDHPLELSACKCTRVASFSGITSSARLIVLQLLYLASYLTLPKNPGALQLFSSLAGLFVFG